MVVISPKICLFPFGVPVLCVSRIRFVRCCLAFVASPFLTLIAFVLSGMFVSVVLPLCVIANVVRMFHVFLLSGSRLKSVGGRLLSIAVMWCFLNQNG